MNELIEGFARLARLPVSTYQTRTFSTFKPLEGNTEALRVCQGFLKDRKHFFLTLSSESGYGKTHLSLAIVWEWFDKINKKGKYSYPQCRYYHVENLMDDLRQSFGRELLDPAKTYEVIMNMVKVVPLLILDDLGVEQQTSFSKAKLDEIIDERYINERLTVITTNMKPSELPKRIARRLKEGVVVVLTCGVYYKGGKV